MCAAKPVLEQLYPLPFDPHEMCKHVLSLHTKFVPAESERLLKKYNYPNTYTFTKTMAEHIIQRGKGNLPLVIVRPSIIGCSWKDPVPGWIDALTAAGGLILTAGLGVVRDVQAGPDMVADLVPVDFVVNTILKALFKTQLFYKAQAAHVDAHPAEAATTAISAQVATPNQRVATILATTGAKREDPFPTLAARPPLSAGTATQVQGSVSQRAPESIASDQSGALLPFVFQSATSSSLNSVKWGMVQRGVIDYWGSKLHPKALVKSDIQLYSSKVEYLANVFIRRQVPFAAMRLLAAMPPPVGSETKRKLLQRYGKALDRATDLNSQFSPFTTHEWVFDNSNTKACLDKQLTEKASTAFATDTYEINWYTYVELYSYGMMKYIIKNTDGRSVPTVPASGAQLFSKASL